MMEGKNSFSGGKTNSIKVNHSGNPNVHHECFPVAKDNV
jgi:hypothetical protein